MKTPIEFVTSEISITTGQSRAQAGVATGERKPRPHIVANRAARQARRANH